MRASVATGPASSRAASCVTRRSRCDAGRRTGRAARRTSRRRPSAARGWSPRRSRRRRCRRRRRRRRTRRCVTAAERSLSHGELRCSGASSLASSRPPSRGAATQASGGVGDAVALRRQPEDAALQRGERLGAGAGGDQQPVVAVLTPGRRGRARASASSALSSKTTISSLGPAMPSMPTRPLSWRLASGRSGSPVRRSRPRGRSTRCRGPWRRSPGRRRSRRPPRRPRSRRPRGRRGRSPRPSPGGLATATRSTPATEAGTSTSARKRDTRPCRRARRRRRRRPERCGRATDWPCSSVTRRSAFASASATRRMFRSANSSASRSSASIESRGRLELVAARTESRLGGAAEALARRRSPPRRLRLRRRR